jgi:hypothetical protein
MNRGINTSTSSVSSPEFKVPSTPSKESGQDSNPQLRILNSLGNSQVQTSNYEEIKPVQQNLPDESTNQALDMFRTQPAEQNVRNEEVKVESQPQSATLIDPSKLIETPPITQEVKKENIFFDVNSVKDVAQDITAPAKPDANIENLMYTDDLKHENKFFVGLEPKPVEASTPVVPETPIMESKPIESTAVEETLDISDTVEVPKYKQLKEKIAASINEYKLQGIKIYKEEVDFGGTYQIIIRIDK